MTERRTDAPIDDGQRDQVLHGPPTEDDYSGRDGGTSNQEAVRTARKDGSAGTDGPVPEETRSPAPPSR
jgi:hypothetical protein